MRHNADRPYKPRTDSLPWQVVEFFRANPDEELTTQDIDSKFGQGRRSNAASVLTEAVANGLLAVRQGESSNKRIVNTYTAGPRLLAGEYPEPTEPPAEAPAPAPTRAPASPLPAAPPAPPPAPGAAHAITLPALPPDVPVVLQIHIHIHTARQEPTA